MFLNLLFSRMRNFLSKHCTHINDEGLVALARRCPDLRKVQLQGCRNIQDEGVVRLAESCPQLEYLCVSNCSHLTDACLLALSQNCPRLNTLECASVSQFTDTGFQVGSVSLEKNTLSKNHQPLYSPFTGPCPKLPAAGADGP